VPRTECPFGVNHLAVVNRSPDPSERGMIVWIERGRRQWRQAPDAQPAVYGNRRRVRGERGQRLLRGRRQYVERSFAHVYDTCADMATSSTGCWSTRAPSISAS